MSKKEGFRMFPERLPQRWAVLSYGARAFAYDWWRSFEDDLVTIPLDAVAMSMAVPPKARRYLAEWLKELHESGAVTLVEGGLRMAPIMRRTNAQPTPNQRPSDAGATLEQRPSDAGATLEQRPSDAGATLEQRPTQSNNAKSLGADSVSVPTRALQRERQRERETEELSSALPLPSSAPKPDPTRFRQPLEDEVRAEFFRRKATPQKAGVGQWRDGCQTVQDALQLKAFPDAHAAITAFAKLLVDECARGSKLGFALQDANLGAQLEEPVAPLPPPAEESPRGFW